MLVCWLVFPVLLGAAVLGTGLAVERVGGWRMPGTLLGPVGAPAILTGELTLLGYGSLGAVAWLLQVSVTTSADPTAAPVRTVAPRGYRSVCLAHTDWVEVVR